MRNQRQWLNTLRTEKGYTMRYVSDQAGIAESHYCLIESGERRPSPQVAKKIAAVLDFDWTRFYEDPTDQKIAQ